MKFIASRCSICPFTGIHHGHQCRIDRLWGNHKGVRLKNDPGSKLGLACDIQLVFKTMVDVDANNLSIRGMAADD